MSNLDKKTVNSFSDQWVKYDQSGMSKSESLKNIHKLFFYISKRKNLIKQLKDLIWDVVLVGGLNSLHLK